LVDLKLILKKKLNILNEIKIVDEDNCIFDVDSLKSLYYIIETQQVQVNQITNKIINENKK
jgi:hypothetical protein